MLVPPHDQPEPEFPFQYLAADYFQYMNKTYCVIVDRYFHRPITIMSEQGSKGDTRHLRRVFSTFSIRQEQVMEQVVPESLGCPTPPLFLSHPPSPATVALRLRSSKSSG